MELTPAFSIIINGQSNFPADRVISIKSSDQAGFVSDSCKFELDDFDNAITMPNTEAKFELSLGYKETGLTKIGTYFVKEIILDGARRVIKIEGNAACKAMLSQKTKNHEGNLSDVVSSMASDVDLDGIVADEFDELDLDEEVQFAESPLILRGFPSKIPTRWIISKVEHQFSSSGFSTSVDCCSVG